MKRFLGGVCVGLVFAISVSLIASELFYKGKKVYVIVEQENLRSAPNGEKLAALTKGSQLVVLEDGEKWVKVGISGYIWKQSITGNKKLFSGPAYRASMILLNNEADAQTVLQKLKAGEDFAALAKQYSQDASTAENGGDLGEFYKGDFAPEIENEILKLKPNQISGIVKTKLGYHIFKRVK